MRMRKMAERAAYAFKTYVLRRELPYLLGVVITDKCNLNCFYCESKNSGRYHMSFDDTLRALDDAYARGHRSLYFTGGEPMIWRDGAHDLAELVRHGRQLGFHDVFIFTNGTVPLQIEECNYIVTVDGPRRVHESIRPDTYDLIMDNVRHAVTRAVFASITLVRSNIDCIEDFAREIRSTGLFRGISFNLLTHWPQVVAEHGIPLSDRAEAMDRLWRLKQEGHPIVLSRAAWQALRTNRWKRPIRQIELLTKERLFTCCRDIDHPEVCAQCGYSNCVEVAQILGMRPSAMWQVLKMVG